MIPRLIAGLCGAAFVLSRSVPALADIVLPVPYDAQDNMTTTCGSCGSASTGMGLAYLGQKNSADAVEQWLYSGLPCVPGPSALVSRANAYCSSHGLSSPCAQYYNWTAGSAWGNLVAELNAGRPFVAHVHQYGYSHYVLVTGYASGQVYLNDPVPSHKGWRSWGTFSAQWAEKSYDGIRFLLPGLPTCQGECKPGQKQSRPCCDCGTQTRACNSECSWGAWSDCSGPDPEGGNQVCDTAQHGPCAQGRMQCRQGCLACIRVVEPVAELCDAVDNDCDGEIDDGNPVVMSTPPPSWAGQLADVSYPRTLDAGETGRVWAAFRNVGSQEWRRGQLWIASASAAGQAPSAFYGPGVWPAWNVAAVLDHDVPPGSTAFFEFEIVAPAEGPTARDQFRLMTSEGVLVACPEPSFEVELVVGPALPAQVEPEAAAWESGGWSCSAAPRPSRRVLPLLGLPMLVLGARRRR